MKSLKESINEQFNNVTEAKGDVTTKEIYELANSLSEQDVDNILAGWDTAKDTESVRMFKSLVSMGDSRQLAIASVIADRMNKKDNYEFYRKAYMD